MLDSHSPRLLQDIFDSVIDHLRDEKEALSQCCLVSKSWVPLSRKYLFFRIRVFTSRSLDRSSKACQNEHAPRQAGTFSEWLLMNPPASYVRALEVDGAYGGRIRMPLFSRVEKLFVECGLVGLHDGYHLIPFGELAGSLKSLRVDCLCGTPHSQVFGLIHSLPGLEDLTLSGNDKTIEQDRSLDIFPPSTPIALTGALGLCLRNMGKSIRLLLDLQGGLHFKKLTLRSRCTEENFPLVEKLLKACSDTLECLDIECTIVNDQSLARCEAIDLSTLTKLKYATLWSTSMSVEWAFTTLKSIRSDHLQQALIYPPQRTPNDRENRIIFKDVTGAHPSGETRLAPGPVLGRIMN